MLVVSNNLLAVEDGEKRDKQSSVPVICDTTAIVTLARQVSQGIQWQLLVLVQEHLLLSHANPKVRLVELVRNVPTKSTKFPSLLYEGVKETESEEKLPPGIRLVAVTKKVWIGDGIIEVGAKEVSPKTFGRLVGHFHS